MDTSVSVVTAWYHAMVTIGFAANLTENLDGANLLFCPSACNLQLAVRTALRTSAMRTVPQCMQFASYAVMLRSAFGFICVLICAEIVPKFATALALSLCRSWLPANLAV
ncbi:hypothetical protein [Paraburkholderia saeva]|uniref:hypothetical protein n=1 Tax=Paraburkholderia saeva TaxID=2777537 RepID=UPI001E6191C0|nr:hypothetical protein [Paraburkholderia saeva]